MARKLLAGALVAVLVLTSGCLGFILGDTLSYSANKATVGDNALSETSYDKANEEQLNTERSFEVAGESRDVEVTNWITQYEKSVGVSGVGEGTVATFTVLSSPRFELAGESVNPLARYNNRQLVQKFVSGYGNVRNIQETDTRNVTMLGSETEVSTFTGTAQSNGASVEVNIHVTKVEHGDDIVVVMAVHPKQLDESDNVSRLIEGVEHEGE
ncbi:DUF6517 family protein [Haladaptatus cibarius]|uniref:DUF6517 family protein n=1 Tax=Haladaptatus cibarius TaxID=453847 RepID=UPI000679D604|nr:DUF6517 family protein [Haladaptatus cibarius]